MRSSALLALAFTLAACRAKAPDNDGDGFDAVVDCNDDDASVNTDAAELCNGVDDDCTGSADDGATDALAWYLDADADGAGNTGVVVAACEQPAGYVAQDGDCDDSDSDIHPGAEEDCEVPVDNNCDGSVGYADVDGDGWAACEECDDQDAAVSPAALESCNGADDDCDGDTDEDGALGGTVFYMDTDGDGFGDGSAPVTACEAPAGAVADGDDCDDANKDTHPGADETCDDVDQNCNGVVDEAPIDPDTFYLDADGDGAGGKVSVEACEAPVGYVTTSTDCDDLSAVTNPTATEICDAKDNDCDGAVPATETTLVYADADSDGHGNKSIAADPCTAPTGYVLTQDDCDDVAAASYPGATEICDAKDNDCDGAVPATETTPVYADADGDGHGNPTVASAPCNAPSGYVASKDDCNDVNAATFPGAPEVCDVKDNDCDGAVPSTETATLYADNDADGYGTKTVALNACQAPSDYVSDNTDCDDSSSKAHPGAADLPGNGKDDDCKGDGDRQPLVYVVDRWTGDLWAVNRVTGATAWSAATGKENIDVTVGPDGTLYTDNYNTGGIFKVHPTTHVTTTLVAPNGPMVGVHGINYDYANDTLVVTNPSGTIFSVDPTSGAVTNLVTAVPGGAIDAMRLDGDPRYFITARGSNQILTYTPSTGVIAALVTLPEGPNLITPSIERGKFFTSVNTGTVYEIDTRRRTWRRVGTTGRASYGNCGDPMGGNDLILGDHVSSLWTMDSTTGSVALLKSGLGQTWGCAFDSQPDLDGDTFVNRVLGGSDCDDFDAAVNPLAADAVDGSDQNCDGVDGIDKDGDSNASVASGGTDCDDNDASKFIGKGCAGAVSCLDIQQEAWLAPDGTYSVDPLGTGAVNVFCDMTRDGGGWTLAVNVRGTSIFHADQPAAVGDVSLTTTPSKLSDTAITTLNTLGYWRWDCGPTKDVFVRNTAIAWTSMKTNSQVWSMDNNKDGVFECAANRAGYVFSDFSACSAGHTNYAAAGGAAEGNGCYHTSVGWGQNGRLWAK